MPALETPVYEEPQIRPKGKFQRVLLPLMDTPGEWAKVGEYKTKESAEQAVGSLRHGRYLIPGEPSWWEFISDGNKVYARYIADANEDPA